MLALFYLAGPGIGMPTLRNLYPELTRNAIEDLLTRYRRLHTGKNKICLHLLRWHKAGSVWAMDFSQPHFPVDNEYRYVFHVRDLASGCMLLAQPVPNRELHHVVDALRVLFARYGAPLVLKSDNEFDTDAVFNFVEDPNRGARADLAALLKANQVNHLLSPRYHPQYNGAIEAGIGGFKARAHLEAARHGRPLEWNCDDVEAARLQANEESRPWGFDQDSPDAAWADRTPLCPLDRLAFIDAVNRFEQECHHERRKSLLEGMPLDPQALRACRREAICQALVELGFLFIRRKRFTQPLKRSIA